MPLEVRLVVCDGDSSSGDSSEEDDSRSSEDDLWIIPLEVRLVG